MLVFISEGMSIRIPEGGLSISVDDAGNPNVSLTALHVVYEIWPLWLEIALDHAERVCRSDSSSMESQRVTSRSKVGFWSKNASSPWWVSLPASSVSRVSSRVFLRFYLDTKLCDQSGRHRRGSQHDRVRCRKYSIELFDTSRASMSAWLPRRKSFIGSGTPRFIRRPISDRQSITTCSEWESNGDSRLLQASTSSRPLPSPATSSTTPSGCREGRYPNSAIGARQLARRSKPPMRGRPRCVSRFWRIPRITFWSMSVDLTIEIGDRRGQGTVTVGPHDPWARVWRRAMTTGKPTYRWKGVAVRHEDIPYAFGFFGVSRKTRRLAWFPAAHASPASFNQDHHGQLTQFRGRPVDHLTLDPEDKPGRYKSHFTYEDGGHGPTVSHQPRPGELIPWFSLLLHDMTEDTMRVVPEMLRITFPAVREDHAYPAHVAGEGGWGFIDTLPKPVDPCFIQFDVWAGMTQGWDGFLYSSVPWVYKIGVDAPQQQAIHSRAFQAPFEEDRGCVVVMSWILGELDAPRLMRANRVTHVMPSA